MNGIGRTTMVLGTAAAALLALLVLPGIVSPASAAPVALAGSNSQQWAYGAQKWVNVSENFGNATYEAKAFFGWQVVFTATNTSSTTVALEAQRTIVGSYFADLCAPNCASPTTGHGNLSVVAWEKDAGFANLTSAASVYENGTAVPAVGLLNASAQVAGNVTEQLSASLSSGLLNGSTASALYVSGAGHDTITFAPALGLVPQNVSGGATWNASSDFAASGGWSIDANWSHTSFSGATTSGSFTPSGNLQGNGTIDLRGGDLGLVTLRNGATVPVIALAWSGPFDDVDGVILVPHDFDLFGDGSHAWASASLVGQAAATANVNIVLDATHHLRVVAAATSFSEDDTSLSTEAAPSHGPQAAATTTTGATVLQAQPEPVAQAQGTSGCYVGQCAASASGAHGLGGLGLALLVGLVVAVVVGSVGVVEYRVWARRRAERGLASASTSVRAPLPPPPGAYLGGAAGGPVAPPAPPAPREEPPRSR